MPCQECESGQQPVPRGFSPQPVPWTCIRAYIHAQCILSLSCPWFFSSLSWYVAYIEVCIQVELRHKTGMASSCCSCLAKQSISLKPLHQLNPRTRPGESGAGLACAPYFQFGKATQANCNPCCSRRRLMPLRRTCTRAPRLVPATARWASRAGLWRRCGYGTPGCPGARSAMIKISQDLPLAADWGMRSCSPPRPLLLGPGAITAANPPGVLAIV